MTNLIICLIWLNIGISSNNTTTYNRALDEIYRIIKEPLPCRTYDGEPMKYVSVCHIDNLNTVLKHYKGIIKEE